MCMQERVVTVYRLKQCSSSVAAPFYAVAYGLPINQGLVGADICVARCQHPLITSLLTIRRPPHKTTVLPLTKSTVSYAVHSELIKEAIDPP